LFDFFGFNYLSVVGGGFFGVSVTGALEGNRGISGNWASFGVRCPSVYDYDLVSVVGRGSPTECYYLFS